VSPANDFANLAPAHISFKTGGYITGVIGILIFPWKLIADPSGYIFTWLVGYSALLGPIGGIMIADYYFIRRQQLHLPDLYQYTGRYAYQHGFNLRALLALAGGILPNIPGFLVTIGALPRAAVWPWLVAVYDYAWFVGFFLSAGSYLLLMAKPQRAGTPIPARPAAGYEVWPT
jgi:NCS1 family nucleobase:cation symporter-1